MNLYERASLHYKIARRNCVLPRRAWKQAWGYARLYQSLAPDESAPFHVKPEG